MKNFLAIILLFFCLNGFSQKNFDFKGNLQLNQKINDIWGYNGNGREYALLGGTTGTFIIDITIATNPVQLFFIPGDTSIWRDIKTYQDFAYVTNEEGGGLLIIDLSDLPNSIQSNNWTVGSYDYQVAHNIFIDENGIAYLFGSNIENQGAFMLDLNAPNKYEPTYVGNYNDRYCHDGFVRNDILWTSEIYQGDFSVVDISDKSDPVVIARQNTSTGFTHQCWLSDDNDFLITTDEKGGSSVDIYDVSDLENISFLDKYRSHPDNEVIPHNTFFKGNDYIFTSYYRDGVTLVDATKKDNIVQVGNYDTSPYSASDGFEGCWGVYPYLLSGNIIASDREEGLFILTPNYVRASYLEGNIIDTASFIPINNVRVEIMGTDYIKYSIFNGDYKIGVVDEDIYDVRFSLPNCQTIIVTDVELHEGQVTNLDIETNCDFTVGIIDEDDKKYKILNNPFQDKILIQFDSKEILKDLKIYNLQGKLVKSVFIDANIGEVIINNDWKSGQYFLKLNFEEETFKEIIIKI